MPHQMKAESTFECENSCGTIINKGDTVYFYLGAIICPECAIEPSRGARKLNEK